MNHTPETQQERRIYLIQNLLNEDAQYQSIVIPESEVEQKQLLRALFNLRPPMPVSPDFLAVQDEYLTAEKERIGIVDACSLPTVPGNHRIFLWQGDITTLQADAIVNAANSALLGCFRPLHSCIDNLIHSGSGIELRLCCNEIMQKQGHEEPAGQAKITPGYNLPAHYVLHTVGPVVQGAVTPEDEALLASCYRSCLDLAQQQHLTSIAFCCISTGVFHFPNRRAAEIAVSTVEGWLAGHNSEIRVIFDVYKDEDDAIYRELLCGNREAEGKAGEC